MIEVLLPILKKFWPYIAIAVLVSTNVMAFKLWSHARHDLAEFKAEVEATARVQEAANAQIVKTHEDNLKKVKATYETQLADASVNAVRNYLNNRVRPNPGGRQVPASGSGIKVDDGAAGKPLPVECETDEPFIIRAAHDAAKVNAWRHYAELNNIPVEAE